jgi:hypothetical protein
MKNTKLFIIPLFALLLVLTGCGSKENEANNNNNGNNGNNNPDVADNYLYCTLQSNDKLSIKEVTFIFNETKDYVQYESLKETYDIANMYAVYGDQCGTSEAACGEYVKNTINARCGDGTNGVSNCYLEEVDGNILLTYDIDPYVDLVNGGVLESLSARKDDLKQILVNAGFSCY